MSFIKAIQELYRCVGLATEPSADYANSLNIKQQYSAS